MKKLFLLVCILSLLVFSGTAIAQDVEECTISKGTVFGVIHYRQGPISVIAATDTKITILRVDKDVPKISDPSYKRDIAFFSLSHAKPVLQGSQLRGKVFLYDNYAPALASDEGFAFYEDLKDCSITQSE